MVTVPVEVTLRNRAVIVPILEDDLFSDRMNIFVLDSEPQISAQMMCDKHVCKMAIEYTQLLCNARHLHDWKKGYPEVAYRPTHINHPCTKWVADSLDNYLWLQELTLETWREYKYRFNRDHACSKLKFHLMVDPIVGFPGIGSFQTVATPPPQCVPEEYRCSTMVNRWANAVHAYHQYYIHEKYRFARWTKRDVPKWFTDGVQQLEIDLDAAHFIQKRKR